MTDDPRYSPPQQSGQRVPNQRLRGIYPGRISAAHHRPEVRLALHDAADRPAGLRACQSYGPYEPAGGAPRRKRSRIVGLTVGALAIAAVSAGVGGAVATMVRPDGHVATTVTTAAPNTHSAPTANPTANAPVGSVEQVAAKVVPSVVKLETKIGRASEEGSGIILSEDGLILTNNHVVEVLRRADPAARVAHRVPPRRPVRPRPPNRLPRTCRRAR